MYNETLQFYGPNQRPQPGFMPGPCPGPMPGPCPCPPPCPPPVMPCYPDDTCFDPENLYTPDSCQPRCTCGMCCHCRPKQPRPCPPPRPMPCEPCCMPTPCRPTPCESHCHSGCNWMQFCNQKVMIQIGCARYKVIVLSSCGNFLACLACCNGKKAYFNLDKVDSITPLGC